MKQQKGHPKAAQKNRINSITELLNTCKGIRYYRWLEAVAIKPGILTHELSEVMGLKSNNHHNADQHINPAIEAYGWRIEKRVRTKPNESWGWHLVKIKREGEQ
ncbi:hypothetical protein [Zobellella denitrificans]